MEKSNNVKIKIEENNIREKRTIQITKGIIYHSIQIALLRKILREASFSHSLLQLVFDKSTDTENTTIELQARQQFEKHLKAALKLAKELIKITELEGIIDPTVVVPLGTKDLLNGYAELVAITENDTDDFVF